MSNYSEQEIKLFIEETLIKHNLISNPSVELSEKYPERLPKVVESEGL